MEISAKYSPKEIESKWYEFWLKNNMFRSVPDERKPYTIVIPPPNVTGILHMGHMLNNTIQDILIRKARMQGYNACWVPGTDHASIATEAKVVAKLKAEGIEKSSLTREEFLKHAWEWKEKHGGIILEQLKKLGASCDWERTKFTMDDDMSESVLLVFIDLYNKGYIYRGNRMVNWDPKALTALSDEEVIYKEVNSKLYYVKYFIHNEPENFITIATTRPETILGDTAICVHPDDERYKTYIGKKALVPLINRIIPIIADDYVEREFGTGALKVTPAHDANDYILGQKHNLETIDILNNDGTLNEKAQLFVGEDRFVAREKMAQALSEKGHLVKIEDIINKVGFSERTDVPIEPKISVQWFLDMSKLKQKALENVMNDNIKFYPDKFKNIYKHWMENIKDWCISRQLWWGHRIPAYYLPDGRFVVALTKEEALAKAQKEFNLPQLKIDELKQDEDVLDTWFSSWLWPISVFDGIRNPNNPDIKYYYPTDDLVTAPEIIFFWVARMIMAGYEYLNEKPFKNVYFTGTVRDKIGRKMSKSLGNSPDPLELIEKYGADGVRLGMMLCSPAGNDLLFDESLCEQGRNFCNKIWNALRLIKGWTVSKNLSVTQARKKAVEWFDSKLNYEIAQIEDCFAKYKLSEALKIIYRLVWEDFCSWYLEAIKPAYQSPIDIHTYNVTIYFFETLLKLMHPFLPFITEELYHQIKERNENESIMKANYPSAKNYDIERIEEFEYAKEVVNAIRNIRTEKNIPYKEEIILYIKKNNNERPQLAYDSVVCKLANIKELSYVFNKVPDTITFIVRTTEFFIPYSKKIDKEAEIKKIKDELEYMKGFLNSVVNKLSNEKFLANASPSIIENEKKKKTDAETKIKLLEEQLKSLMNN